jgi:hypothetical protein
MVHIRQAEQLIGVISVRVSSRVVLKQHKTQGGNKQLDLDKGDTQVVANDNTSQEEETPGTFVERLAAKRIERGQANNLEGVA